MAGGPQREFCKTEALENAMNVFWKKGYVGASLTDLTDSMGINKPSMYAAFGNKEQLFIKSAEHYVENYVEPLGQCLFEDKPLKDRLRKYLLNVIEGQCRTDKPKGCFMSMSISESEGEAFPKDAAAMVENAKDYAEKFLSEFLNNEKKLGSLPYETDTLALARYFVAIMHGTAAMARGGKSNDELRDIIETALNTI